MVRGDVVVQRGFGSFLNGVWCRLKSLGLQICATSSFGGSFAQTIKEEDGGDTRLVKLLVLDTVIAQIPSFMLSSPTKA